MGDSCGPATVGCTTCHPPLEEPVNESSTVVAPHPGPEHGRARRMLNKDRKSVV